MRRPFRGIGFGGIGARAELIDERYQSLGPGDVGAVAVAETGDQRAFLDVHPINENGKDRQHDDEKAQPISEGENDPEESEESAGVGRMPDEAVRTGIDKLMVRGNRDVDGKEPAEPPDRIHSKSEGENKNGDARDDEELPGRQSGESIFLRDMDSEKHAERDDDPHEPPRLGVA